MLEIVIFIAGAAWAVTVEYRLHRIERCLRSPLPRAVTSRGVVQLAPEMDAKYFRAKRDMFPPNDRRWELYEQRARQVE